MWEAWSPCTKSCAGGLRIRARRKCQKFKEPKEKEKEKKEEKNSKKDISKKRNKRQTFEGLQWLLKPTQEPITGPASVNTTESEKPNYNITLIEEPKCEHPDYWKIVNQTEACNEQKCPSWTKWLEWETCTGVSLPSVSPNRTLVPTSQ